MTSPPSVQAERRTQEERSTATRTIVNDAVIDCLVSEGYSGTTMSAVTEAAGVSRGAITHQYGTKRQMLLAAIEDLVARTEVELRAASDGLPAGDERPRAVLALLWGVFQGDLFYAMLEMWAAARTDHELRQVLQAAEREQGRRHRQLFADLLGPSIAQHPNFGIALDLTFNLMRGVALTAILRDNPRREHELIDQWTETFLGLTRVDTHPRSSHGDEGDTR